MTPHPLAAIVSELLRFGIPHMLAGSFASTYHGDPRTTNDIDLVIDPTPESLQALVQDPRAVLAASVASQRPRVPPATR